MVADNKIDVVIPISDDDALVVAHARDASPDIPAFVAPPLESVKIARDKIATFKFAQKLGLPTPESVVARDADEAAAAVGHFGFPAVLKAPVSLASTGVSIVATADEMRRALVTLPAGPLLVQKFIPGDFVGATGFAANGTLIDSFSFRALSQPSGTPPYSFTFDSPRLHEMLQRIVAELNWTGGIDLDVMRDNAGNLFLMEINPRFSGTLVFADKLGIDLPALYLDFALGKTLAPAAARTPAGEALFISVLPTEVALISKNPMTGQQKSTQLRQQYKYVENFYEDDGPLLAAQLRQALFIAWNAPRFGGV
jgi:carbamoyl-phosphate synthase large subunit